MTTIVVCDGQGQEFRVSSEPNGACLVYALWAGGNGFYAANPPDQLGRAPLVKGERLYACCRGGLACVDGMVDGEAYRKVITNRWRRLR